MPDLERFGTDSFPCSRLGQGVLGAPAFRRAADVVAVPGLGSIVLHRAAEAGSDGRAESLGLYGDYLLQLRATKNQVWSPLSAGARR